MDGKKEWAAKVAYLEADEEAYSAISLNNNLRYSDGIETPYEDIARGNNFFNNGFTNMSDIKVKLNTDHATTNIMQELLMICSTNQKILRTMTTSPHLQQQPVPPQLKMLQPT
jgi:hypothetical protein